MVREAIFNILGPDIIGARFADLFAGSGAVGLEALSRGADRLTLLDKKPIATRAIRKTLSLWDVGLDRARCWETDVFKLGANESEWARWDIVFLDPPRVIKDNFLDSLVKHGTLKPGALVIVERPAEKNCVIRSDCLQAIDQRVYGKTAVYFFN